MTNKPINIKLEFETAYGSPQPMFTVHVEQGVGYIVYKGEEERFQDFLTRKAAGEEVFWENQKKE